MAPSISTLTYLLTYLPPTAVRDLVIFLDSDVSMLSQVSLRHFETVTHSTALTQSLVAA